MNSDQQVLRIEFARAISGELDDAISTIRHCVNQLSEDQLWWRESESMNSIANLILHLCGNVEQWILSGVGGEIDSRDRPREFSRRGGLASSELLDRLETLAAAVRRTLKQVSTDELLRTRTIQVFEVTGMQAIVASVAHFRGHTQEIIHLTRTQLGDEYRFDFVPEKE